MISTIPWSPPAVANEHPKVAHVLLLRPRYGSKFVPSGSTNNQHDCARKKHIFYPKTIAKEQKGLWKKKQRLNEYPFGVKSPRS